MSTKLIALISMAGGLGLILIGAVVYVCVKKYRI
jgi:hypothetical protein